MDARFELWEQLCTCGGARKFPDVRMCSCDAAFQAGLDCQSCRSGVLLIKEASTTGRLFLGCSMYKKKGCKYTKSFGPPYDRDASLQLGRIQAQRDEASKREHEELSRIVDPHEIEWRNECRCEGARNLETLECYMRSQGGCGFLPSCPQCEEGLFLKNGRLGQFWSCQHCRYSKSYKPHLKKFSEEPTKKKARLSDETEALKFPGQSSERSADVIAPDKNPVSSIVKSSTHSTQDLVQSPAPKATKQSGSPAGIVLSPDQKTMIERKRQAALAKCKRRLEKAPPAFVSPDKQSVAHSSFEVNCKNPRNEPLYRAFCELTHAYSMQGNYITQAAYSKVSEAIRTLDVEVTAENAKALGQGKNKVANIGRASAEKMYEFVTCGTIKKLEEKKAALRNVAFR